MQSHYFDSKKTPLCKGVNLIEASAGTGKTYAIAMLALRFIVEENIAINELLVVTFTKAATEELKDRIRIRLVDAKKVAAGGYNTHTDSIIVDWLKQIKLPTALVLQRLELALLNIDQANILTIHGFCQRVLQQRPMESGQLFTSELITDVSLIYQQCADDFWRRHIYPRSVWEAGILTAHYKTPDALLASIAYLAEHITVYPALQSLDTVLAVLKNCIDAAKNILHDTANVLRNHFTDDKFKSSYTQHFDDDVCALYAWLHNETTQLPHENALNILTEQTLKTALNGNKFKTNKTQSSDERKTEYLASLTVNTQPFNAVLEAISAIDLSLRGALLTYLRTEVEQTLVQRNQLSFESIITRLASALRSNNGAWLIQQLQHDFKVALIDEFQDTDDAQWCIFSSVFATPTHYLYLIGDPKQAIYKFRGADIYSYLAARQHANHLFTLTHNWRSHPQLVEAVNYLFQRPNAFFLDGITFQAIQPGLSTTNGYLRKNEQALAPMMLWQLPQSETKTGYWTSGTASAVIRHAVVNEIIELLTSNYAQHPGNYPVQAKDIAILVRSNRQARDYQHALRAANIPSVLSSLESVFATSEALALYTLLRAIADPSNVDTFKQALTLDWFGLNGQALYQFINDEVAMDNGMVRFLGYYQDWQKFGLMTMMSNVLAQENIQTQVSKSQRAERQLTNIQHLLELVQEAVIEYRLGINKTVDWLHTAIATASNSDNQQLRLESDENTVKIVTTHRAKGLEYYIVFCPYLWQHNNHESSLVICHENGAMIADIGSKDFARRKQRALDEALAEDLRVLYVALTRAKYRCYLAWADVRTEKQSNQSAMAWLLEFVDTDFTQQQTKLKSLKTTYPTVFEYQLLQSTTPQSGYYQKAFEPLQLQARKRRRFLYTPWQMSSYTALSALTIQNTQDKLNADTDESQSDMIQTVLPQGVLLGNVVHTLLEHNSFYQLAQHADISVQRDTTCLQYGLKLEQPECLDALLHSIVTAPLSETDRNFCLMNLQDSRCLKEMPFYLSMSTLDTREINAILHDSPVFQPLSNKQLAGYLTGFIDLVCEYKGCYYLIDYKTNTLADYDQDTILQAMREHNYGLQYWLYTLVLHCYLQAQLPNYNYEQHFGGVRYLFVRGLHVDKIMYGVFQDKPAIEKINALETLFGQPIKCH